MIVVALLVVVAGVGYGYFRYQWSKVSSGPCSACVAAANGPPYNVLLTAPTAVPGRPRPRPSSSDATNAAGQRSDTIKIVHVDPAAGTRPGRSPPHLRDALRPSPSRDLTGPNKINSAFGRVPMP